MSEEELAKIAEEALAFTELLSAEKHETKLVPKLVKVIAKTLADAEFEAASFDFSDYESVSSAAALTVLPLGLLKLQDGRVLLARGARVRGGRACPLCRRRRGWRL